MISLVKIDAVQPLIGFTVELPLEVTGSEPVLERLWQEFERAGLPEMQESFILLHQYDLDYARKQVGFAIQTDDYSSATHAILPGCYAQFCGNGDFWLVRQKLWAQTERELTEAMRSYTTDFEVYYTDGSKRCELYIALNE